MCVCDSLFEGFSSQDLESIDVSHLARKRGVYAIRVHNKGKEINEVISSMTDIVGKTSWNAFNRYLGNRLERLRKIRDCPLIYIGAAPTSIKVRYQDLSGVRHTIFFPILALLLNKWELDYLYKETNDPLLLEESLKEKYEEVHGYLPALVKK